MSNPYGGDYPSYQPAPNPYQPSGGSYGSARTPFDGVSLASLICSVTCCAAPIGIALGIAGLVRTSGGRRTGRWAAVTGLAVGIVATLAMVGFVVFAVVLSEDAVQEDEARAGMCVDVNSLDIVKHATCEEPHDGEIAWAGTFTSPLVEEFNKTGTQEFCRGLPGLESEYAKAMIEPQYEVAISIDAFDEDDPSPGDRFYCYLVRGDGTKLTGTIADGAGSGTTGARA